MNTKKLSLLVLASMQFFALAAKGDWIPTSGTNDYGTTANWDSGTINGVFSRTETGSEVVTTGSSFTLTTGLTFTFGGNFDLTLDSAVSPVKTITLGGDINVNLGTGRTVFFGGTVGMNTNLGANRTFTVSGNDNLQFTSAINTTTSAFRVTKAGTGTLIMVNKASAFNGIDMTAGTLRIGADSILSSGAIASGPVGQGILRLGSVNTPGSAVTFTSRDTGTHTISNSVSLDGDVTFGASSTFTGAITLNTTGTGSTSLTTPNTVTITGTATGATARTMTTTVKTTIIGAIGDGGNGLGIIKSGTNILQLGSGESIANTYTGMTTVNTGELDLGKAAETVAIVGNLTIGDGSGGASSDVVKLLANDQISSSAAVLINASSGELNLNNFNQTISSLSDTGTVTSGGSSINLGSGTLTVGDTNNTTFSGAIAGTGGSLIKQGSGTLALATANTYTGTTTLRAGALSIGADNRLGGSSAGITFDGGTLTGTSGMTINAGRAINVTSNGGSVNALGNMALAGTISGSGTLTKLGATGNFALIISGANSSFSGAWNDSQGILKFTSIPSIGTTSVPLTVSNYSANSTTTQLQLAFGTGTNTVANPITFSQSSGNTTFRLENASTTDANSFVELTSSLSGSAALSAAGLDLLVTGPTPTTGGWILSANNSGLVPFASGKAFTIRSVGSSTGVLVLNNANAVGAGNSLALAIGSGPDGGYILARTSTVSSVSAPITVNQASGGTTPFDAGIGTDSTNGSVTYSGQIIMAGSLSGTPARNVNLRADGASSVIFTGPLQDGTLNVGDLASPVLKIGAGTVTLSGTGDSYSGGTTVNAGTLVGGTDGAFGTGSVTVASGAVLQMNVADTIDSLSALVLNTGGTANLNYSGTQVVASLLLGGVSEPAGFYDATSEPTFFSGTGEIEVAAIPEPGVCGLLLTVGAIGLTLRRRKI